MLINILVCGGATATLRWILKSLNTGNTTFTTDDLRTAPTDKVHIPLRLPNNEYIGTIVLDFLLEMPPLDAFRLLNYDAAVLIRDSVSETDWRTERIVKSRSKDFYLVDIGDALSGSKFSISFTMDGKKYDSPDELMKDIYTPTTIRRVKEIAREQSTNIDTSNVPEIKVSAPPDPSADDDAQ